MERRVHPLSRLDPMHAASDTWSRPRAVFPGGREPAIRFLNVAAGRTDIYVVGNEIELFDGSPVPDNPLTAMTLNGRTIGKPVGRFTFSFPTAAVDSQQRLHLVWAELAGGYRRVPSDLWTTRPRSSIWTARYAPNVGWSTPEKIYDGATLSWAPGPIAGALPVTTFTGLPQQPVLLLRRRDDHWSIDSITTRFLGAPAYAVFAADGTFEYLATIGADPEPKSDENSVFFQRSTDGGRTWTDMHLISRSGSHPAHEIKIAVAPDGVIHLVWLQVTQADSTILRHASSRDHGATWSSVDDYAVPTVRRRLRSIIDRNGVVHVAYEDWSRGPYHLRIAHATWNGQWTEPRVPFPEIVGQDPALTLSAAGRPLLVFLGHNESADTMARSRLLYSELVP